MTFITVVPYDPVWPILFDKETKLLSQALGDNCIAIHHIGSTSIPGLSAKPIIDILPVVKNIQEVDKATQAMEALGYDAKGEGGMAFKRFFTKGNPLRTHNVHVHEEGNPEIDRYLKFRDWMRSHPDDALAYAALKKELAEKFSQDIFKYCSGKDDFVASIDTKTEFTGWRMVQALTDKEWAAVDALRNQPLEDSLKQKNHIHFVFYRNAVIIGYAHLQLYQNNEAILQCMAIDENHRNLGFGSLLLKLCERWLKEQGFPILSIYPSQKYHAFYSNHGYTETPLDNPLSKKSLPEKSFLHYGQLRKKLI
ncbi:MAG: bifunctional GrpB family protein/GNAT family N-acetyltransferase [Chlamydiota bacterium]